MKYEVALVSYINTCPFTDGLSNISVPELFQFQFHPPSICAHVLLNKKVDMALIPVGSLVDFPSISILPEFCIGATGPVDSVFIFAHQPIEKLENIWLDPHSRSSNGLAQILTKLYWHKNISFLKPATSHSYLSNISGSTGGVVIGDKALKERKHFPYTYDLADHWYRWTGLPFVFAVWAYYPQVFSPNILREFTNALREGIKGKSKSAIKWADHFGFSAEEARHYLEDSIDYEFNRQKHEALRLYLSALKKINSPIFLKT